MDEIFDEIIWNTYLKGVGYLLMLIGIFGLIYNIT
jgi:hypothetical protein